AAADQHRARRARGLGAGSCLPPAGRAGGLRRDRGPHRRRERHARVDGADGVPGATGARAPAGRPETARIARPAQRAVRLRLRRALRGDARPDRGERLGRLRRADAAHRAGEAGRRRAGALAMKAAVVGGGLAGLAAALDLVDCGHHVTVYEARPTLGGAVQTLPEREGDPDPPPDNGQHIALGCFTEYLRFLARIGEAGSVLRKRLALPVVGESRRVATIRSNPLSILGYRHLDRGERLAVLRTLLRLRTATASDGETFGDLLRRLGQSQ